MRIQSLRGCSIANHSGAPCSERCHVPRTLKNGSVVYDRSRSFGSATGGKIAEPTHVPFSSGNLELTDANEKKNIKLFTITINSKFPLLIYCNFIDTDNAENSRMRTAGADNSCVW